MEIKHNRLTYTPARLRYTLIFLFVSVSIFSQNTTPKQYAAEFFKSMKKTGNLKTAVSESSITQQYRSPENVKTPLYVFQAGNNGFAIVAESHNTYKVVGYSDDGNFDQTDMPPQLKTLMSYYEDSLQFINTSNKITEAGTPVVSPLLDEYGIRLNQYHHPEVDGSWTGCMATAVTQIMLFQSKEHNKPIKGYGSHCYTYGSFGNICADFDTTYDDPQLLSFNVAVSMNMRFTNTPAGSSPPIGELRGTVDKYFHFFVTPGLSDGFYIKSELDHRQPLYTAIPGDPIGHAIVIDGYDNRGYMHLNFGWGGSYNGYYQTGIWIGAYAYKFMTYFSSVYVINDVPISVNQQDSLALVALHNALGGQEATGWDLTKTVWEWPGVTIMYDRVIQLALNSKLPAASEQSIPTEIGNLTELRDLYLSGPLSGNIPSSITNLTKLHTLSISNSPLYKNNQLYKGNLKGVIPENIGNMSQLETMFFSNALTGTIPSGIGNLHNLVAIIITQDTANFGKGELTGALPPEFENLINLRQLIIPNQKLNGNVLDVVSKMNSIAGVDLSGNELSGTIPVMNNAELMSLKLNDNQYSTIKDGIWNCPDLEYLEIRNNNLERELSGSFCSSPALKHLELSNNKLTSLPENIGNLISLETLSIDNNNLIALPEGIAFLQRLGNLSAANNDIAEIPQGLGQSRSLKSLNLSYNNITFIPEPIGNCQDITQIVLNDNKIDSIPGTFANLPEGANIYLQNNEIQGRIPEKLMTSMNFVRLDSNRFVFKDIPKSDKLIFGLHKQKSTVVRKQVYKVQEGDSITIDMRSITNLSSPDDEYYWFVYPDFTERNIVDGAMKDVENNPVLRVAINEQTLKNSYYCKVLNPNVQTYTYTYNGYVYTSPALEYINTDTISFKQVSDEEILEEKYPDKYVTSLNKITNSTVSDRNITLVPPMKVKRGEVFWQTSIDGKEWEKISDDMQQTGIKANVIKADKDELVLSPRNTAYYRCCIHEKNCDTIFSDKLEVKALGNILFDDVVNVTEQPQTISVDSIEVVIPKNFHDSDFRMTITKINNPPAAPDSVVLNSAYDVSVSFTDEFNVPLLIKLKNIDATNIKNEDINKFYAVYYDDQAREWKLFDNYHLSMKDSSVMFTTNHLTKVSSWWTGSLNGYTDVYKRNNISVYYKDDEIGYMKFIYGKKQISQSWHISGIPLLVQDITEYLPKVMAKYKSLGLNGPDGNFNVYVQRMSDAGCVGLLGMTNGYMLINAEMPNPVKLKKVLAHEFMHYTQDYYISANPGNSFWMEAHASVADRVVWSTTDVPVCESEITLTESKTSKNSIFNFLSNSWDYWDKSFFKSNLTGNIFYNYLAGTFLHYMQICRPGTEKLDNAKLLKETAWTGTWRNYLAGYIKSELKSDMGSEYEDFIKYILSGQDENFTLLNSKDNPYSFIEDAKNKKVFTYPVTYSFKENEDSQTDNISIKVPYLATKVVLLNNLCADTLVMVNYKRNHSYSKDHLVYYVSYNPDKKEMTYTNITDSTEFNFLLDPRNKQNIDMNFRNYGMILLINKEYNSSASSFNASFTLTATPVMNIERVCMLSIYKGDSPVKHNFTNGQDYIPIGSMSAEYLHKITKFIATETNRSVTKEIVGDTIRIKSKYTLVIDQKPITGIPTMVDSTIYTQDIKYDIISGLIKITEFANRYYKLHTFVDFVLDANGEVTGTKVVYKEHIDQIDEKAKTYYIQNFSRYIQPDNITKAFEASYGDNIIVFETNNTTETQNVIKKIDAHYKTTENGGTESQYSSTDYSDPNLKVYFIVKTQ